MLFCESLNEQALKLLEGPANGAERIPCGSFLRPASAVAARALEATESEGEQEATQSAPSLLNDGGSEGAQDEAAPLLVEPVLVPAEPEPIPPLALGELDTGHQLLSEPAPEQEVLGEQAHDVAPVSDTSRGGSTAAENDGAGVLATQSESRVLEIAQDVEANNMMRLLSTPRAKEACKRLGILPDELRVKRLQDFAVIGDHPARQQMRFNHYENKRQHKLKEVLTERSKVVREQIEKEVNGGAFAGFQSLQMMEALLDQEAKRMERDVKTHVRLHGAIEKQNQEFISKERLFAEREAQRSRARQTVEASKEQRAIQLRSQSEAKFRRCSELIEQSEHDMAERNASYVAQMLDDEQRLQDLHRERQDRVHGKSEKWQQKMEVIEQRQEDLRAERQAEGLSKMATYHCKLELLDQKRDSDFKEKMIKHEEQSLKLVDAREKRVQLDRQSERRRMEVANKLESQEQRIDTLFSLKDQILEQRRARNQQRLKEKSHTLQLRSEGPGPAAYDPKPSSVSEGHAPKISSARTKILNDASIDAAVERAQHLPAPGQYDPKVLPTGDVGWGGGGPVLRNGKKTTYLDQRAREVRDCPGPGAYNCAPGMIKEHVAKFGRNYMACLEVGRPPKPPAWAKTSDGCGPGPAAYNLDKASRRQIRRTSRSLPALARALSAQ